LLLIELFRQLFDSYGHIRDRHGPQPPRVEMLYC
jgi:hypothetical protein